MKVQCPRVYVLGTEYASSLIVVIRYGYHITSAIHRRRLVRFHRQYRHTLRTYTTLLRTHMHPFYREIRTDCDMGFHGFPTVTKKFFFEFVRQYGLQPGALLERMSLTVTLSRSWRDNFGTDPRQEKAAFEISPLPLKRCRGRGYSGQYSN